MTNILLSLSGLCALVTVVLPAAERAALAIQTVGGAL